MAPGRSRSSSSSPPDPRAGLARPARRLYRESMLVEIGSEAADFVRERGGTLWVWAAHPRMCCTGAPAWMHAATAPPPGLSGFSPVAADGVQLWFRGVGNQLPDVLEIGLRGTRRPRVEAYWDGCLMAMV